MRDLCQQRIDLSTEGHEILAGNVDPNRTRHKRQEWIVRRLRTVTARWPAQYHRRHAYSRCRLPESAHLVFGSQRVRTLGHARAGPKSAGAVEPLANPRFISPARADNRDRIDLTVDL